MSPPPFALILGMLCMPQSLWGLPGGLGGGLGLFDPPQISPAPGTAEPAGLSTAPHNCGLIVPSWRAAGVEGDREKEPSSFSFPLWLLPLFSSCFGEPGRAGEGASPSAPAAVTPGSMRRFRRGK